MDGAVEGLANMYEALENQPNNISWCPVEIIKLRAM